MAGAKGFLGRGWPFPVQVDLGSGRIALVEYEDDVKQSIRIILATKKGERVMRPRFGCGVHDLVFDSMDTAMISLVASTVREALLEFEPRIDEIDVTAQPEDALRGKLSVNVSHRLREANRRDNLVYAFYLGGNA